MLFRGFPKGARQTVCLENMRLSLSEPLEGLGGWDQSVSYYGGWEEVGLPLV